MIGKILRGMAMRQNTMLAMILAGGRGSRLHDLTKKVAKPAVYYGGKYRIIDFSLSNCANSNIKIVGVLTQYESTLLNAYAAAGQCWGLDAKDSGVYVLPPREKEDADLNVYRGTADAISQNLDFIDGFHPEHVLILSGDHIYKMDYAKMLAHHKHCHADVTIAVLPVAMKEASRFGIMNVDETDRILAFEEKPILPKSNLASMGIYIFNWRLLKKVLLADMVKEDSHHDFGKDIIPMLLEEGKSLYAYRFQGYWKDVGTIDSLWQANMDLLKKDNTLDLADPTWKIYTQDMAVIPQYIGPQGSISTSYVNQGCIINGVVKNSVVFTNVKIEDCAEVYDAVLMPDVIIGEGAIIHRAIIAQGVKVDPGAVVGDPNSEHIELVSKRVR